MGIEIKEMLDEYNIPYYTLDGKKEDVDIVVSNIVKTISLKTLGY